MQNTIQRNGGPYTKSQQTARREEVQRLHFEFGYSAARISQMMGINRNTINSDIQFLYSQISEELQTDNIGSLVLKQIHRLERQRGRQSEELEKEHTFREKQELERFIFLIDDKMSQIITKIIASKSFEFPQKTSKDQLTDDRIKTITRKLVFHLKETAADDTVEKNYILFEIIRNEKCDKDEAERIFQKMRSLGLGLCTVGENLDSTFRLAAFAYMCGYISSEEFTEIECEFKRIRDQVAEFDKEFRDDTPYGHNNKIFWTVEEMHSFNLAHHEFIASLKGLKAAPYR